MRPTAIALLLACAVVLPATAQHRPIQPGQQYQGGARLSSAVTGVSFVLPAQYVGAYDGEASIFLAASQANPGITVGVWAFSEGALEEIVPAVGEQLAEIGIQLYETGPISLTSNAFSGLYGAMTEQGVSVLYAEARRGSSGNSLLVAAIGASGNEQALRGVVGEIVRSGQLGEPGANAWRAEIGGTAFLAGSSADQYSPGGVGAGSFVSQTDARLEVCSNGEYAYQMQSKSYVSVEGAGSMSSNDSDQHNGRWRLVATLIGEALLVLNATDGRSFVWSADQTGQGRYMIDGTNYIAAPSQMCR